MAAINVVQRHLGGSKSDVLRQSVVIVAEALSDAASIDVAARSLPKLLAVRGPVIVEVDEGVLADVRNTLREVAERYTRQAFLLQKIGNNWNQIAKVANSGAQVDADAMRGVERALELVARVMDRDAQRDAMLATKLLEML
ncbi:plasmid mobilization relaxosome protein MobC [Arthrobacter sp.]|uniref:plasmid mobilization relaxosome protein MobC n=1 Tax=Arthrobacter sp. TaxID=1667 RepID=UPI003A942C50